MNKNDIINSLSTHLRMPRERVIKLASSAPYKYKHYQIEKRSGGMRDIYQPTAALKEAQRWIIENILSLLPVANSAYAYRIGRSILNNAEIHRGSNYFARYDFVDFFHSIRGNVIYKFLRSSVDKGLVSLDPEAMDMVVKMISRKCGASVSLKDLSLTIGAPSSPMVTNTMLYDFDLALEDMAKSYSGVYSRYADDIFLSARSLNTINAMCESLISVVAKNVPYLTINHDKTRRMSRRSRINICGIIITPDRNLSVGRDLKRWIRGAIYRALSGRLDQDGLNKLKGYIAYVDSIERGYLSALREKYRHHAGWINIDM